MSPAARNGEVAGAFTRCADQIRDWDAPAPVAGWTARDVVAHLVEWLPGFLTAGGVRLAPDGPSVDADPAGAWRTHANAVQALLESPDADRAFTHPHTGAGPLDATIDRFYTTDVFLHRWDLARAGGLDDRLDEATCAGLLAEMEPWDEVLRASGQYGPRVPVREDAPAEDRLMAFVGRDPAWRA